MKKIGITLVSVFSVLLINLLFNIIPFINSFFLGTFGLLTYPIFVGLIVIGVLNILNKQVSINSKTLILYIIDIILLVCIIHTITSKKYLDMTYGGYLKSCYNSKYTAGGLITGILSYPVAYLTHFTGAIVIFVIAMIISTTFIIDKYITNKQYKEEKEVLPAQDEVENIFEDSDEVDLFAEQDNLKPSKPPIVDDDIFIQDDESTERKTAKSILGLNNQEKISDEEEYIKPKFNRELYQTNSTPKFEPNKNPSKPSFIYHGDDNELDDFNAVKSTAKEKPKNTEKDEKKKKAVDFLNATRGTYKPLDNDSNDDIYDPNLSMKSYDSHKEEYKSKNDLINKSYNDLFASNSDDNEIDFEPITIKPSDAKNNPFTNKTASRTFDIDNNTKPINANNYQFGTFQNERPKKEYYNQMDMNSIKSEPVKEEKPQKRERFPERVKYVAPTTDLLKYYQPPNTDDQAEIEQKGRMLEATLESFKIPAKITSVAKGPAFTRYELQMPAGIPVRRVTGYVDDIAMSLESKGSVRMEVPIPGKNAFGVEVPNKSIATVSLRDVLESKNFQNAKSPLTYALGQDIANECRVARLEKAPHLLVAGSTGSGKSVCLNSMLISWLFKASPDDVRLILIDPKQVEFTPYNKLPHLLIPKVITNTEQALCALTWSIDEMERRYSLFSQFAVRNIEEYNDTDEVKTRYAEHLPYIVVVVDELADLMSQSKKDFEEKIMRLTQKSRAAGIHLVLATQRPSVDVITGTIKNNLPSRIAFAVSSFADSKTIIGESGAENLLGKGDMLFAPQDDPTPSRIQGAFLSNDEIKAVLDFVKDNNDAVWDSEIEDKMFNRNQNEGGFSTEAPTSEVFDPLLKDALRNFIKTNNASVSKLQRIFNIGFNRAGRIVDQMESAGFVSPKDSKNNRVIFCTQQEFEERFGEDL